VDTKNPTELVVARKRTAPIVLGSGSGDVVAPTWRRWCLTKQVVYLDDAEGWAGARHRLPPPQRSTIGTGAAQNHKAPTTVEAEADD